MHSTPHVSLSAAEERRRHERAATAATRDTPLLRRRARGARLGERLRQLRVAAGLTQSELAGQRFSKEYVSQIERGKTRPTPETVEWLAARLGVDRATSRAASPPTSAGASRRRSPAPRRSTRATRREALREYETVARVVAVHRLGRARGPRAVRRGLGAAADGDVRHGARAAQRARMLVEGPGFADMDRAEVLSASGSAATSSRASPPPSGLFNEALTLAERSELPGDHLRSEILGWRSRCYRRQRDLEAAREDVERRSSCRMARGPAQHRRTPTSRRRSSPSGSATRARRNYAEQAKELYEQLDDEVHVGRLLNNLGGLNHMLGSRAGGRAPEGRLRRRARAGTDADAAQSLGGIATVHLHIGE